MYTSLAEEWFWFGRISIDLWRHVNNCKTYVSRSVQFTFRCASVCVHTNLENYAKAKSESLLLCLWTLSSTVCARIEQHTTLESHHRTIEVCLNYGNAYMICDDYLRRSCSCILINFIVIHFEWKTHHAWSVCCVCAYYVSCQMKCRVASLR